MKKLLLIFVLFISGITLSCQTKIVEVDPSKKDLAWPEEIKVPTVEISKSQYDLIGSFRPAVRDVAMYILTHKESCEANAFRFKCGKFEFWIANGYDYFRLDEPMELGLSHNEKQYFWDIYNEYRYKKARLYRYEDEIKIVIKQ